MSRNAIDCSVAPMVSVVMIAYNKEKYIEEAIKGVVCQKADFNFELIIMDDCSVDATPNIIEQYRKRYPSIIKSYRNEHNLGLQQNYIEGFRQCKGKYMAICDADDYWFHRRKLQKQVDYMESHPDCAVTFHRVVNYYESSGEKSLSNGGQPAECSLETLSRSNFITNLSVMYRRALVDLENLPEWIKTDKSPDYAMHMLYASRGGIHFFKRPMGVYRKSEGSAWSLTDEFTRLRMSLFVRLNLMAELQDKPSAVEGLHRSAVNILAAMMRTAPGEQERKLTRQMATEAGLLVDVLNAPKPVVRPRKLLQRAVRTMSRFIPLPRP